LSVEKAEADGLGAGHKRRVADVDDLQLAAPYL